MAYRQKEYNYNDKLTKDQNLLMDKLYKMRMSGMAEAFENQLMNPNSGLESFETRFSEIINHEWSGRENKKFNRKRTIASTCSYASFSAIIVSHDTESKKLST